MPDVDVVVELIGGSDGPAKALVERALAARQARGHRQQGAARHAWRGAGARRPRRGVTLAYEAAVAGGIPVIKALREGLAGNRIDRVAGILNGTCNYILTTMREEGRDFAEVLADAQELGYAEADPAFDIDGMDAAHKLADSRGAGLRPAGRFLRRACRRHPPRQRAGHQVRRRARLPDQAAGHRPATPPKAWRCACIPAMVPQQSLLASVEGVYNAVLLEGDFAGTVFLQGRGAGAGPTAYAVVADLIDIARGISMPVWGTAHAHGLKQVRQCPSPSIMARISCA